MAIVNISVDTKTRESVLTVDGQIIPAIACHLSKGVDFDGEPFLSLSYVTESPRDDGMTERHEFRLQRQDDDSVIAEKVPFQKRALCDDEEFKAALAGRPDVAADIHEYFESYKQSNQR